MSSLSPTDALTLQTLREQLHNARGPHYWRALDELIEQPAFRAQLQQALPQLTTLQPAEWQPAMGRRSFLKLLGASLALAGLGACSGPPPQQIVPWTRQPDDDSPSLPKFYTTTLSTAGETIGVLVETHQGRPTKIEGNPAHPASLGAADVLLQAAVLELWDPDRSQAPRHDGVIADWDGFLADAAALRQRFATDARGLHVLSGRIDSPTLAAQRAQWLARFPGSSWHQYEAIDENNARAGAQLAFGAPLLPRYRFDRAEVVVALEADFLGDMPGHLRHAHDFAQRRQPDAGMNRLYAIEATPSLTGAKADHAWPLASAQIGEFVLELAAALGIESLPLGARSGLDDSRIRALVDDLRAHRGSSLLLAGRSQPPQVHALVQLINQALGNDGRTLEWLAADDADVADPASSFAALVEAMRAGEVDTLLILDGNPAYAAPSELKFADLLQRLPHSMHLGLYDDETAACCHWHLPRAHALEAWSDARAFDGSASIVQPVIAPLYGGRSAHEVLAMLLGSEPTSGHDIVRNRWRSLDDAAWQQSLRSGVIASSAPATTATNAHALNGWKPAAGQGLELLFRADATVWDGRHANNGWLQECPKPLTRLTWSNAALVSPALARERGLHNGDVVELRIGTRVLQTPVWILPGQAAHSITLPLGYGRRRVGHVGENLGFDANLLRSVDAPWVACGVTLRATGQHVDLASTQQHHDMQAQAPVRDVTLAQLLAGAAQTQHDEPPPSLYPPRESGVYAWGMSIDLNSCIGCNACTIACQAENNIPVVGAEETARGREMHWVRVDRYYAGTQDAPRTLHQPVPCMHCEHAPCELVCPVGATVHDSEGLNLQVYNRCIGTRFCSNNCPYKVRRFNFLQYADVATESFKAQRNPDVSVRNRGVMEKCTYCIQRIETAHIAADREGRPIADGDIVTACQATCPTRAISFGNVADPATAVSRQKSSVRHYSLLQELNTRPRTTYLAAVRNPNPALGDDT